MSSFAKGNPFSLFFGDPFFWDPLFSFFFDFLSPAKVGSLGAKLQAYLGVIILQPHACTQRFRLRILRRTRSNAGRTSAEASQVEYKPFGKPPLQREQQALPGPGGESFDLQEAVDKGSQRSSGRTSCRAEQMATPQSLLCVQSLLAASMVRFYCAPLPASEKARFPKRLVVIGTYAGKSSTKDFKIVPGPTLTKDEGLMSRDRRR